jgi:hypothetical protein
LPLPDAPIPQGEQGQEGERHTPPLTLMGEVQLFELRELVSAKQLETPGERGDIWMGEPPPTNQTAAQASNLLEKSAPPSTIEKTLLTKGKISQKIDIDPEQIDIDPEDSEEQIRREANGISLEELMATTRELKELPFPDRVRSKIAYFRDHLHASERELQHIEGHVPVWNELGPPLPNIDIPAPHNKQNARVHAAALKLQTMGVLRPVRREEIHNTARLFIKDEGTPEHPKERFITDCHAVNPHLAKMPFTMEGPAKFRSWLPEGSWQVVIDLASSYYHSYIHPAYQQYFGAVSRDTDGGLHYWLHCGTSMGYGQAGYANHMQLVPIIRFTRRCGVKDSIYVDDITVANPKSELAAYWDGQLVRAVLTAAHYTINYAKSDFVPKQRANHIGFTWDCSVSPNIFSPTPRRVERILESLEIVGVAGSSPSCYQWLSAAGRVVSTEQAGGCIMRVAARSLQQIGTLPVGQSLHTTRKCTPELADTVQFLKDLFALPIICPITPITAYTTTTGVTDHSETGFGAGLIQVDGKEVMLMSTGPLQEGISAEDSSTLREVSAGMPYLLTYGEQIRGKRFGLGQDNTSAVWAYKHGSSIEPIQQRVLAFHKYCFYSLRDPVTGIPATVFVFWMPRETQALVWADNGSKDVDINDYQATVAATTTTIEGFGGATRFGELSKIVDGFGGPHDNIRAIMPRFWARHYFRTAEAGNAFLQDWREEGRTLWLFPPIAMIPPTIHKLEIEPSVAILTIAMWQNQMYYPLLFNADGHARPEIRDFKIYTRGEITLGAQGRPWFLTRADALTRKRTPFVALLWIPLTKDNPPSPKPGCCVQMYFTGFCKICRPKPS